MCDLFWQSPADQGDLSDVVRASLQLQRAAPRPRHDDHQADMLLSSSYDLLAEAAGGSSHHQQLIAVVSHGDGDDDDEQQQQQQQQSMAAPPAACDLDALLLPPQGRGDVEEPELLGADADPNPHIVLPIKRRRKSQTKKVVCIPAPAAASGGGEVVPSDLWAWRKYGQKPIKGSPYPRGYYRCSSSKGCSARKQVERSRSDPTMLVVTYTSDHNHPWPTHRNALAGSTRPSAASASSSNHSIISSGGGRRHQHRPPHQSHPHHLKQEHADYLFGAAAGISMDAGVIFSSNSGSASQLQQDQDLACPVDSKQQQLLFGYDPHNNFGFFD